MKCFLPILAALGAPLLHADTVLGKVGSIELTTLETREALAGLQASRDAGLAKDPAAVGHYVRALLIQRLVLQQAEASRFDKEPATIAKLVRARETALADAFLETHSTPPAGYPSEAELQAAYESAKPSLQVPRAWRLAQIFVTDESKLASLRKQLSAKGADFAALARSGSQETTSAANGGEIGWVSETEIQPAIKDKLPKLAVGGVTDAIRLDDGWHFIKLLETREPGTATLAEVRPQLVTRLRADRAQTLRTEFIAGLLKEHPMAINEIELSKILTAP